MPGGKHENTQPWSPEEDQVILEMHALEGPKWSKIVQQLPNRSVSSIRNRWQRIEHGRKLRESGTQTRNRCHACGLPKRGHVCMAKLSSAPRFIPGLGPIGAIEALNGVTDAGQGTVGHKIDPVTLTSWLQRLQSLPGVDQATVNIARQLALPSVAQHGTFANAQLNGLLAASMDRMANAQAMQPQYSTQLQQQQQNLSQQLSPTMQAMFSNRAYTEGPTNYSSVAGVPASAQWLGNAEPPNGCANTALSNTQAHHQLYQHPQPQRQNAPHQQQEQQHRQQPQPQQLQQPAAMLPVALDQAPRRPSPLAGSPGSPSSFLHMPMLGRRTRSGGYYDPDRSSSPSRSWRSSPLAMRVNGSPMPMVPSRLGAAAQAQSRAGSNLANADYGPQPVTWSNDMLLDTLVEDQEMVKLFREWSGDTAEAAHAVKDLPPMDKEDEANPTFRKIAKTVYLVKQWRAKTELKRLFRMLE